MNEKNMPKTSFDYLEGIFVRILCAWIYVVGMKSYCCLEEGWYLSFFGMIPHKYIQQSTIEIEGVMLLQ